MTRPAPLATRLRQEAGFTFVELLTVVLVLAILAALAIPAFASQKSRAFDADAKAAVHTAQTAIESWYVDNRAYAATAEDLRDAEPSLREGAGRTLTVTPGDETYVLRVTSTSGDQWLITKTSASIVRSCIDGGGDGACPPSGSW